MLNFGSMIMVFWLSKKVFEFLEDTMWLKVSYLQLSNDFKIVCNIQHIRRKKMCHMLSIGKYKERIYRCLLYHTFSFSIDLSF